MTDNTQTAIKILLEDNGLTLQNLETAFAGFSGREVDYADFYFQRVVSEGYVIEESMVKTGLYNTDMGVGVRAVSGDKSALAYSDEISLDALMNAVETVKVIGSASEKQSVIKLEGKKPPQPLYQPVNPVEHHEASAKIALIKSLDEKARKLSPLVTQVVASVNSVDEVVLIAKSDGTVVGDVRPLVRIGISVIVEKNGRRESGRSGGGGRFTLDWFTPEKIDQYAEEAVKSALQSLEATPAPAGSFPVVLGPGWPGVLLHEAVGHGLEGDFNRKQTSVFANKVGQRVAAPGVTIVDDGTIPDRRGSRTVDEEGNPSCRTGLIEDGMLKNCIQHELNATLMGLPLTGNGRRESFAHLPLPRMTNTFMLNGTMDPKEILESVDYGIFAQNFAGGQVDITSGQFAFTMNDAWLIENGKLTAPVKGATLIGSGHEALLKIKMIGNDMALDGGIGSCGKDGQSVPVGVGMPTLRIDGLTIGGIS
ncbi:MAG: metalloprotease TldD [Burkholderiales bacterium]|nr:metalloprotease TldD [Burkholderiales bacterium]